MVEENPYQPPEHYATRSPPVVRFTAYLMAGIALVAGVAMTAMGLYYRVAATALFGQFLIGTAIMSAYFIVKHRGKSVLGLVPMRYLRTLMNWLARTLGLRGSSHIGRCAYCEKTDKQLYESAGPLGTGNVFACDECDRACIALTK